MEKNQRKYKYGLVGRNIEYSFSKKFFSKKFKTQNLSCTYENFDMQSIEDLPLILSENIENLKGFNVTIPYKETIFKYLDVVDAVAEEIGAVNTVKIVDKTYLKGFNTDYYGFIESIKPLLEKHHKNALILGSGGAAKAIKYGLKKLNINYKIVSRNAVDKNVLSYNDLTKDHFKDAIIINCTPLGTHPNIDACPKIPYQLLTKTNLLFDLVYNPLETEFLKKGCGVGAITKNGLEMLELQAEKAWKIWNNLE